MRLVHSVARAYGWSREEIQERMYLDELLVHRQIIDGDDRARARLQVMIQHGDPKETIKALTTDEERRRAAYAARYDAAAVNQLQAMLAGTGGEVR